MTGSAFTEELENAADQIADIASADLQHLLRQAAMHLRDTEGLVLDADVDELITSLAADLKLPRRKVLETIVRDWLISGGRFRFDTLDEESETDETA
jgi:hypothetical protein